MVVFISWAVMSACVCDSGVCCDGCAYLKHVVCDGEPLKTFYKCSGNLCGVTLEVTYQHYVCDGMHADCPYTLKKWTSLATVDECTFAELCFGGGADGYCYTDPLCCVPSCAGALCGDDGCGGTCGECPDGMGCVGGVCVEQKGLCEQCFVNEECAEEMVCLGYKDIGGMCLPTGCAVDGDCPIGMACTWVASQDTTVCWVQKAGTMCIGDDVWYVNTCGMPYVTFTDCSYWAKACFEGDCCEPQCRGAVCGDDRCGGVCGVCGDEQVCVGGVCASCEPGAIEEEMCDDACGQRMRVCEADGVWGAWSVCVGDGLCGDSDAVRPPVSPACYASECEPGETLVEECERCGRVTYVCGVECTWTSGGCVGLGECERGEFALCEEGVMVCTDVCMWSACHLLSPDERRVFESPSVVGFVSGPLSASNQRDEGCSAGRANAQSFALVLLFFAVLFGIKMS